MSSTNLILLLSNLRPTVPPLSRSLKARVFERIKQSLRKPFDSIFRRKGPRSTHTCPHCLQVHTGAPSSEFAQSNSTPAPASHTAPTGTSGGLCADTPDYVSTKQRIEELRQSITFSARQILEDVQRLNRSEGGTASTEHTQETSAQTGNPSS